MLQTQYIRDNRDRVLDGLLKRNIKDAGKQIAEVLKTDEERRAAQSARDEALSRSKTQAREIGQLMQAGKKEEAEAARVATQQDKALSKDLTEKVGLLEEKLRSLLYNIPNVPNENVPAGTVADDNEVVGQWGEAPTLYDGATPHWDLIKKYDIIDFDLGNKIAGAGFPVYKGKGARIQRAMINFFLDEAREAGYIEIQPPIFINEASGYGTGQLPDKEGQMYHMTVDNLYAIPTAEVPITNIYRDEVLNEKALPVKNVGYTPCFRREAGAWGANVRGLNRLHQFDKVEIVQITTPEASYEALTKMIDHVTGLLQKLELPYRVLNLCGGDLGFTAAQTFDMEVYSAAQKKWLEVSSVSNFETYQANRLKLRYKNGDGRIQLLHTLNGSGLALPRVLAALLENNQSEKGIKIPEVLVPYTGFEWID
ncbi:MAG: serine--tRNA ligase [Cyclobacteriaceae bacterium]|nr:serine--tRNA ligase [Cyclobacteriaceae bacterium]